MAYLLSLGAGLLAGLLYSLLPTIALVGLLGILIGEQAVPVAKRIWAGHPAAASANPSPEDSTR